jgi:hypothetical protein
MKPKTLLAERALAFFRSIEDEVRQAVFDRMRDGGEHGKREGAREPEGLTIGGDIRR